MTAPGGGFKLASAYVDVGVKDNTSAGLRSMTSNAQGQLRSTGSMVRSSMSDVSRAIGSFSGSALGPVFAVTDSLTNLGIEGQTAGKKMLLGGAGIAAAGVVLAQMGDTQADAVASLRQAIENAGFSWDDYKGRVTDVTDRMQNYAHSTSDTNRALQIMTQALQDPTKALDRMQLVADLAAARHISLASAAQMVARVYGGSARILRQFGITMQVTAGDTESAEKALDELGRRVSGQAKAQMGGFADTIDIVRTKIADWVNEMGNRWAPSITALGVGLTAFGTIAQLVAIKRAAAATVEVAAAGSVATAEVAVGGAALTSSAEVALANEAIREELMRTAEVAGGTASEIVTAETSVGAAGGVAAGGVGLLAGAFSGLAPALIAVIGGLEGLNAVNKLFKEGSFWDNLTNMKFIRGNWWESSGGSDSTKQATEETKALSDEEIRLARSLGMTDSRFLAATDAISQQTSATQKQTDILKLQNDELLKQHPTWRNTADVMGLTTDAYIKGRDAAEKHAQSIEDDETAMRLANDAAGLLKQGIDELNDDTLSVTEANIDFLDSMDKINAGIKENGRSLDINNAKGRDNISNILDSIKAAQDYAEQQVADGQSAAVARAEYQKNIGTLREHLKQMGFNEKAIDDLIAANAKMPVLVTTEYDINTADGETKVAMFQAAIDEIKQGQVPGISANTAEGQTLIAYLQRSINDVRQGKAPSITVDQLAAILKIAELQSGIDDIKQGRVPGLTADSAEGKARIAELQRKIDELKQKLHPPPVKIDETPGIERADRLQARIDSVKQRKVQPPVSVNNLPGLQKADALQAKIDGVYQHKVPVVTTNTAQGWAKADQLQSHIDSMHGKEIPVKLTFKGQEIFGSTVPGYGKFASGGEINWGMGGPRDDLVPILASRGEFVVNAESTSKHLDLLKMINAKKMADGGLIDILFNYLGGDAWGSAFLHGKPLPMPRIATGNVTALQTWAANTFGAYGWGYNQLAPLIALWNGESGWRWNALNPSSGAYGIPQSLPASKMASAGPDWRTNPATQIRWGLNYIKDVYGSPGAAYGAWLSRSPHWYHGGVDRVSQDERAYVKKGEMIFSPAEAEAIRQLAAFPEKAKANNAVHIEHFHFQVEQIKDVQQLLDIIHGIPQAVRGG